MPKWLQTTGIFGIGLQSAFLSSNVITAETYTRKELSEKELKNENLEEVEYIILSVTVLVYFAIVSEKYELFKENKYGVDIVIWH